MPVMHKGADALYALAQHLDECCEDSMDSAASLWLSKRERAAWLSEIASASCLPSLAYMAACLRFSLQPHLA